MNGLVDVRAVRCTRTAHARADEECATLPTLVLPRRGVFRFGSGRGTVVADANTALIFHPDEPHRILHPVDGGDECLALRFERSVFEDALGPRSDSARAWRLPPHAQRVVHDDARLVLEAYDPLEREERALLLLATLAGSEPFADLPERERTRLEGVRERIAADVSTHDSLAALAREAGCSPFYLARRFRAYAGTPLHQYRLALRLAAAQARVREGERDLTRLALDLGFASLAHFSAAFKQAYGVAPSARRMRGVSARRTTTAS